MHTNSPSNLQDDSQPNSQPASQQATQLDTQSATQPAASPLASLKRLPAQQRMMITFTFFSMFFGAGNLIFPPMMGAEAGNASLPASIGFILSAVGLPILGVLAVAHAGGFEQLANRVSRRFAFILALAIILTIGPFFSLPRTATTSYEMAITPFTAGIPKWITLILYSAAFFTAAYWLSKHPEILSRTLGRIMAPALIVLIVVLFIACFTVPHPVFSNPMSQYANHQLVRGFIDGYQTLDLLGAVYFGMVIATNVTKLGVSDEAANRREVSLAGLGTGVLLMVIYAALTYIGAVSGSLTPVNPSQDTGASVLTRLSQDAFGPFGTALIGLVFVIACLSVCTGLIATVATFFTEHRIKLGSYEPSYRMWSIGFAIFAFVVSNAGLSAIIKVSLPVLSALYPITIVLVVLGLLHRYFADTHPRIYFWTVICVSVFSLALCAVNLLELAVGTIAPLDALIAALPLSDFQLSWLIPAGIGLVIGVVETALTKRKA